MAILKLNACFIAAALALSFNSAAEAVTFRFEADPFEGSTALTTPGRQVFRGGDGTELFIDDFSIDQDVFSFDPDIFGVEDQVFFANSFAADLPSGGLNVVVLQDSDNDNDPLTPFNAGSAANVIAAQIDEPGAGFFIYFNSGLQLNRLVYSTDLSDNTADLSVLARLTTPTGQAAIDQLPLFTEANFEIESTEVPFEPASALGTIGFGLFMVRRFQQKQQAAQTA
jgi:hypothetical protein